MTWLSEYFAAVLSAAVVVAGLWALWGQRNTTKAQLAATDDQQEEINELKTEVENGFRAVKRVIRQFVAAACVVLGILSFALSDHPAGARIVPVGGPWGAYVGLPDTVEVLVVEADSMPIEGAPVVFLPMTNHGTVSPATAATDAAGRAKTIWTLGSEAGEQHMVVMVLGVDSVWIPASAKAREEPVPTKIKITPASAVLRFVGDIAPFSAEILDQYDTPFPGSVTWSSKRQCFFRAGSYGFATARRSGTDSIVATFGGVRATAPVVVRIGTP